MPEPDLFSTAQVSPILLDLIRSAPLPSLGNGPVCDSTHRRVSVALSELKLSGSLQEAALWLLAGDLDKSHAISQEHKSVEGAFWHGIMHRCEGDFWNAKYWFRQCKGHPVYQKLAERIECCSGKVPFPTDRLIKASTLADTLVDLIEQAESSKGGSEQEAWSEPLQQVVWWEWQLLFMQH